MLTLDEPIQSPEDDQLNRARFADGLADIILNAENGSAFRLGVYGELGEGKSSVLRLMERRLRVSGHVCVWITPWAARSVEELHEKLIKAIAQELGIDARAMDHAKSLSETLRSVREKGADLDWRVKLADSVFGDATQKYADKLKAKYRDRLIPAMLEAQGGRKVVVFVDDLDRLRPHLIPDFLLSVREALNLPNYFYVLALSPSIVQEGLRDIHPGWAAPVNFLEKIVEWPMFLPRVQPREMQSFIEAQIGAAADFLSVDILRGLSPVLPRNPRKLKLFLRLLAGLRTALNRFDPGEVDLGAAYLCQMLRLEFPDQAHGLMDDAAALKNMERGRADGVVEQYLRRTYAASDKAERAEPQEPLETKYADQSSDSARFRQICAAIRERDVWATRYSLEQLFLLVERPPVLTQKETSQLFDGFHAAPPSERATVLRRYLVEGGHVIPERAEALFTQSVELRDRLLDAAVQQAAEDDVLATLRAVSDASAFLRTMVSDIGVIRAGAISADAWMSLFNHVRRWSPWTADYYADARHEELALLREAAAGMPEALQAGVLEKLSFGRMLRSEQQESPEFQTEVAILRERFEGTVAELILQRFERIDGIMSLVGLPGFSIEQIFAFEAGSRFHSSEYRDRLADVASQAVSDPIVHKNFLKYCELLMRMAFGETSPVPREQLKQLLGDEAFIRTVWGAAMARPLNPRMARTLLDIRKQVIQELGVPESALPVPTWWRYADGDDAGSDMSHSRHTAG